ncbi:MAG: hypothetical protein LBR17_04465 [Bacteroidales bacterium]|nr:hypothetical protein [Bacteroidales bacterium]
MLQFFAVAFIVPAVTGFLYFELAAWIFVFCSASCFIAGTMLKSCFQSYKPYLSKKDGRLVTGLIWLILPLIGAVPYTFLSSRFSFIDSVFESFSGFTITGSSIISSFERIPKSILIWRALTQWLGCLGFIIFIISFVSSLRNDSQNFFDTEFNSISRNKVKPHIRATVYRILVIYFLISGICFLLLLTKMNIFYSLCYTFSCVSTGGFIFNIGGIGVFPYQIHIIIMIMMFISGISYFLLYYFITSKRRQIFKDEQVKVYILMILTASLILSAFFYFTDVKSLTYNSHELLSALHRGFFYAISAISTTGYGLIGSSFFMPLGVFMSAFLVILMFPGGCSSSSATGLKIIRVSLLAKYSVTALKRMISPRAILSVKFNKVAVKDESINMVFGFFFLYILIFLSGGILLSTQGVNFADALNLSAANLGNIGSLSTEISTGFEYGSLNVLSKLIIITLMITGRLEIYSFLALFSRIIWSKR